MSIQQNLNQLLSLYGVGAGLYSQTPQGKQAEAIRSLGRTVEGAKKVEQEVENPESLAEIKRLRQEYTAAKERYTQASALPQDVPDRDAQIGEAEQTLREIGENPLYQLYRDIEEEDLPYSERILASLKQQSRAHQRLFELDPTGERLQAAMESEAKYRSRVQEKEALEAGRNVPMQNWETDQSQTQLENIITQRADQTQAFQERKIVLDYLTRMRDAGAISGKDYKHMIYEINRQGGNQ